MIRILFISFLLLSISFSHKHNFSIGLLDDKVGFSIIGYTYNVKQDGMNEYFIGGGTAILAFTGTVGWKHYYRKSKLSISSIIATGKSFLVKTQSIGYLFPGPTLKFALSERILSYLKILFSSALAILILK